MRHTTLNCRTIAHFLGGVISIKLAVLFLVGPVIWPDTEAYISFADVILAHAQVFDHMGFAGGPAAPILVFRLAGYPLVLAAAKLISPQYYGQITALFQILLNILAMVIMVRVLAGLSFTTPPIVSAIGLYAFSDSLLFDNSLLSDSIYSSFFNIVVFALLGHLVAGSRLTLVGASALGLLWGFSTWIRDSGIYLTYLPIGLLIAIAVRAPASNVRRFGHLFTFIIAIFAMTSAYSGFNKYRTGEFFFSITGVENWLRPVFDMAQYGYADPFNDDDLVSQTVREGMPNYEYPTQVAFVEKLHQRCGCTPRQLQSLVFQKYLTTVMHHPIGYIRVVWHNFHFFGLVGLLADPIATINQFFEFATSMPHKFAPGLSIRNLLDLQRQFSAVILLLMLLNALSTAVATVLFSLFLFGIPIMMVCALRRREPIPLSLAIVGFLWFAFVGVSITFSLVHYEARQPSQLFPPVASVLLTRPLKLHACSGGQPQGHHPADSPIARAQWRSSTVASRASRSSKASLDQQELALTEHLPRRHRTRRLSDINSGSGQRSGASSKPPIVRASALGGNDRRMRAIKFTFAGDVKASDTMYSVLFWSAVALLAAWIFFVVFEMVKGLYPVQQLPRVPDEARHDQDKERGKSQHSDPPFLRNPVGADCGEKGVHHVN